MKRSMTIYAVLFVLLALAVGVHAQDDGVQGDLDLFGVSLDVEGVIIQNATGGTFTEIEGQTDSDGNSFYQLRLEGVDDGDTDIVQLGNAAPVSYTTTALALDWARAADMTVEDLDEAPYLADAELTSDEATVFMTVIALRLEEGTDVPLYTVRIEQVIPSMVGEDIDFDNILSMVEKAELPDSFGPATLTISGSELFWTTLASSASQRAAVIRADEDQNLAAQCEAAENPEGDYSPLELEIIQKWYNDNCTGG